MKNLCQRFVTVLFLCACFNAYGSERDWVLLGNSDFGNWNIYIDSKSIKHQEANIYSAVSFQDMGVMQEGIDKLDSNGHLIYDMSKHYRSSMAVSVYDCSNRVSTYIVIKYYTSAKPDKNYLVYTENNDNPIMTNVYESRAFNYVCNR